MTICADWNLSQRRGLHRDNSCWFLVDDAWYWLGRIYAIPISQRAHGHLYRWGEPSIHTYLLRNIFQKKIEIVVLCVIRLHSFCQEEFGEFERQLSFQEPTFTQIEVGYKDQPVNTNVAMLVCLQEYVFFLNSSSALTQCIQFLELSYETYI